MLVLAAVPFVVPALPTPAPSLIWWTTYALDKVRPYDTPPARRNSSVELEAARNEFESFQVVLRADSQDVKGMDIDVSDLKGPGDAVLPKKNIAVYFERFLNLRQPSNLEGKAGEWPDPLIPRIDRYANEKRNAFPFKLSNGRNQPIWIEVYVPRTTPDGAYRGTVSVWINEKRDTIIPVKLQVWNFTLPSTSSLRNSFGFNGISALRQHVGRYTDDTDVYRFTHLYQKAALWHRVSIHGGSMLPPAVRFTDGKLQVDWTLLDEELGPFFDGTVFGDDEPLPGARATSAELRNSNQLANDDQRVLYFRQFASHFREKGWIDRLFNYLWDEPEHENFNEMLRRGRLVHSADPDIKNLVTAPLHANWAGIIDIWTPLVNCFAPKAGFDKYCDEMATRDRYSDEISKGRSLWWYQSCSSHGCNIVGGEYFRGWPSYMIDHSGVANRIMQWMAWKYDIKGELYFNMNEAYSKKQDAWNDVYLFGGNGDGTLVYPGRPRTIGGTTDIPIESIRLKHIRDGLEDYEYLLMLTKVTGSAVTMQFVDSLVTNPYMYQRDPVKLYEVRHKIGEVLSRQGKVTDNLQFEK